MATLEHFTDGHRGVTTGKEILVSQAGASQPELREAAEASTYRGLPAVRRMLALNQALP